MKKLLPKEVKLRENLSRNSYYIRGQAGALNQILLNLTTNALHAMNEGGTLRIQFGLSVDDEKTVRLVVEDSGTGIPADIRQQVFHPFFTTKQGGEGTGIGLTVVKRLTEEHGGSILSLGNEDGGTTMVVSLPRRRVRTNRMGEERLRPQSTFNRTLVELSDALPKEAFIQKYMD